MFPYNGIDLICGFVLLEVGAVHPVREATPVVLGATNPVVKFVVSWKIKYGTPDAVTPQPTVVALIAVELAVATAPIETEYIA
jgi:hypothetical protein